MRVRWSGLEIQFVTYHFCNKVKDSIVLSTAPACQFLKTVSPCSRNMWFQSFWPFCVDIEPRETQKSTNTKLMQFVEISRANEVSYVSCARAYKKLDLNYRQGKVAIVCWMIDWKQKKDGFGKSVAAVFAAPPIVESQSRFDIDCLSDAHNFNEVRYLAETRSSFCGYLFLDDIHNYITKEELKLYEDQKQRGISNSMMRYKDIILNREAKDEGRKTEKQEEREKNITEAKIQKEKEYNEWLRVKKGKRIKEGGISESKESTEEIEL